MRKYKHLIIPNRIPRNDENIMEKQDNYCKKSICASECHECLFDTHNIKHFTEWYLSKNKKGGK